MCAGCSESRTIRASRVAASFYRAHQDGSAGIRAPHGGLPSPEATAGSPFVGGTPTDRPGSAARVPMPGERPRTAGAVCVYHVQ
jgi:hypothetical protein